MLDQIQEIGQAFTFIHRQGRIQPNRWPHSPVAVMVPAELKHP